VKNLASNKLYLVMCMVLMITLLPVFVLSCTKTEPAPTPSPTPSPTPTPPPAEPIEWTIATWTGPSLFVKVLETYWAPEMEKRTNGQFKAKMEYGGTLSTAKEQLDSIEAGLFDMGPIVAHYTPGKIPLCNMINLPTLPPRDTREIGEWCMALHQHPALIAEMDQWNCVYIVDTFLDSFNIIGNKAIRTTDDFKGVKINASGLAGQLLSKYGAAASTFAGPEWQEVLSKGTVDLVYGGDSSFKAYKLEEVSKYRMSPMGIGTVSDATIANKDSWNALPDNVKKVAEELRVEMIDIYTEEYGKELDAYLAVLKQYNVENIEFPKAESEKMIIDAQPILAQWADDQEKDGKPGKEVLEFALQKRKEIAGY
jgi:TRAP-type C4-dicarboxylate transport system substrate-binding protein